MSQKQLTEEKKSSSSDSITVTLGGQVIILRELNVEDGIELCLLVGPYLPGIFKAVREHPESSPLELKAQTLRALIQGAASFPGDLMKIIGLFGRRRPKWISQNATGVEALNALGVIIEQPEFGEVLKMGIRLGLVEKESPEGNQDG